MAFHDWNGNGDKNDMFDNFIEMKILNETFDDDEESSSSSSSGSNRSYTYNTPKTPRSTKSLSKSTKVFTVVIVFAFLYDYIFRWEIIPNLGGLGFIIAWVVLSVLLLKFLKRFL